MPRYKKFLKDDTPHRTTSRKRFPVWLGPGGLGIVLIVGFFLVKASIGNSQTVAPQFTGGPRLSVAQDMFDYGTLKLGSTVETVFRVRNVGDKPLMITSQPVVQVAEGCCPPKAVVSSYTIDPGQEGTITLDFMMHQGMGGKHRFNINLNTNDPKEPSKLLVVLSNWV